jgi:hypothetical protein
MEWMELDKDSNTGVVVCLLKRLVPPLPELKELELISFFLLKIQTQSIGPLE